MKLLRGAFTLPVVWSVSTYALGQTVGTAVPIEPAPSSTRQYIETAIGVNPLSPNEFVVACKKVEAGSAPQVVYGISTHQFGPNFPSPTGAYDTLLVPDISLGCSIFQNATDPMIAVSARTGDIWVGAQHTGATPVYSQGFHVARRRPGLLTLDGSVPIVCDRGGYAWDKPLIAAGPRFGASPTDPETMFLVTRLEGFCGISIPQLLFTESNWSVSPPSVPGGSWASQGWPNPRVIRVRDDLGISDDCERRATGGAPVVLKSGRLVVAYRPITTTDPLDTLRSTPEVMYIDPPPFPITNPLTQWQRRHPLNRATLTIGVEEVIQPIDDTMIGVKPVPNFPGISADPRVGREGDVYVCFAGLADSSGSNNIDLFVARGQFNAQTGALEFSFDRTLHIKDSDLGAPAGTHQFMPWIAVDQQGGINLLYYAQVQSSPTLLKAYYARIRDFQVPLSTLDRPFVATLTAAFPPVMPPNTATTTNVIGDYHQIATAGCYVYVAYMSTETGFYNVYVRRINICTGDVDDNAFVDTGDVPAFASAYLAQSPAADLTADGTVNAWDVATFTEALSCQCNPPPQP